MRDRYGRNTFGQSCLLARRLVEAGTRVVEVDLAQGGQLRQPFLGRARRSVESHEEAVGADARCWLVGALWPTWTSAACSNETLVVAIGEFGRSPQKGVSTSGNATATTAAITGRTATRLVTGGGINAASCMANPTRPLRLDRKPGPSDRVAGDDLSRVRHRSGYDRLQPSLTSRASW